MRDVFCVLAVVAVYGDFFDVRGECSFHVLTDQWPARAFQFLWGGDPYARISTGWRLQGTVFSNAFTTCPLCTPARGTLLTGRWPHDTGITDNYAVGYSQQPSPPLTERTWIDEAARLGYHVGYFRQVASGADQPGSARRPPV